MKVKTSSNSQKAFERFKKNKAAIFSFWVLIALILIAVLAPWISPYPFDEQNIDFILEAPNFQFWLGTDSLGRDMLSRLMYGARVSLSIGIVTALISLVVGSIYGAISGWFGGWIDTLMMRFIDTLYGLPGLVLLILVKVFFDSIDLVSNPELKSITGILLALSLFGWMSLARLVRAQVLQAKALPFVEASGAMGASSFRILTLHIFPNILGPIIVLLTFQIPSNILAESFLSFIGLGLQPPYSSWGVLANEGWRSMQTYPHLIASPSVMLFLVMLSFNFLGDALRDALDPKSQKKV